MNGMKLGVCCLLAGLITAAAGSSATKPVKHFAVVFSGSGYYIVDFGEDRVEELKKKPTSGGGVDGIAGVTWSWTLKTVASKAGDKPVRHDRAILQASFRTAGRFLIYSFFRDGEMSEREIECDCVDHRRTFDGKQRAALRGDWVKWNPRLTYDKDGVFFSARIPSSLAPATVACYHSIYEGFQVYDPSYVPTTVLFEPESVFRRRLGGKSYEETKERPINLPRSHAFDRPQAHTVSGKVRSAITVTRISDETWRKRAKEYRTSPEFGTSND